MARGMGSGRKPAGRGGGMQPVTASPVFRRWPGFWGRPLTRTLPPAMSWAAKEREQSGKRAPTNTSSRWPAAEESTRMEKASPWVMGAEFGWSGSLGGEQGLDFREDGLLILLFGLRELLHQQNLGGVVELALAEGEVFRQLE